MTAKVVVEYVDGFFFFFGQVLDRFLYKRVLITCTA